jgi:HD superfamily phosphodiesterase
MINDITMEMISYFGNDTRRINHALKVQSFCSLICGLEQLNDKEQLIINLAGILHDIGIKEAERKYNSSAGPYQEKEGPAIAEEIMKKNSIHNDISERVCYIIGHHHTYNKIDGVDFQILVEADFLVNIYEDQIDKSSVTSIKDKYFKTKTGIKLLEKLYE